MRGSSRPPEALSGLQRTHRLLIAAALVAGLWGLRTGLPLGVGLHFLGAACLYLLFGARRALLGLALAATLAALLGGTPFGGLPWAWLANGALPVAEWFNPSAPRVKSGEVQPDALDEVAALELMLADPLLIRRPLMEVDSQRRVGFDQDAVDRWIGLASKVPREDLEACAKGHAAQPCPVLER